MTHRRLALALAVFAFGATSASAQDSYFGVQAGLAMPQGDLSRKQLLGSKPGLDLGAHAAFNLGQGHVIRLRTDYAQFQENTTHEGPGFAFTFKASDLSLGVDYLYFVNHQPMGLYLVAGVSGNRWDIAEKDNYGFGEDSLTMTTTKFGYGFGVGYQVNRSWGYEAGYTYSKVGPSDYPINTDVLRLTATIRF